MVSMYIALWFKNRYMFIQSTFEIDLSIVSRFYIITTWSKEFWKGFESWKPSR